MERFKNVLCVIGLNNAPTNLLERAVTLAGKNRAVARTGIPGFVMGNTADTILKQIDCAVLATKPPGFATPVTLEG